MSFFSLANPNLPVWIQAISNTAVLIFIYFQLGQVREQMAQSDEQIKFNRSWEFLQFYQEQVNDGDQALLQAREAGEETRHAEVRLYYEPRVSVFRLLNQLISLQQVDERILFGYLQHDFDRFVRIGLMQTDRETFNREIRSNIRLLLNSWDPKALREMEPQSSKAAQ